MTMYTATEELLTLNSASIRLAIETDLKPSAMNPGNAATGHNNRGNVYTKLGQYQMAIEDFNKAIRLKPDYADAYNNRGIAYTKLGQYQRAIEDFNEAIRLKPDYADTYLTELGLF
jgi:tetratricopeptide (TPR) repeat protein